MANHGKKRGLGRASPSSSTSSAMSIVEKLELLRGIMAGSGFRETDLSLCLRQSGYRVEVAAEKLVTGQFRPSNPPATTATTTTTTSLPNPHKKRKSLSTTTPSSSTPSTPSTTSPATTATATTTRTPLVYTTRSNSYPSITPSDTTTLPAARRVTPREDTASTISTINTISQNNDKDASAPWLLCHRWVGDGVNLSRSGACNYQERFSVVDTTGSNLRFKAARMDGSFPRHLSFLGPLLQENFVRIRASALMEERNLTIGAQVAFGLEVYVVDPLVFFGLFEAENNSTTTHSYSKQFFGKHSTKQRRGESSSSSCSSFREHAFALLQWAQHGRLDDDGEAISEDDDDSAENDVDETVDEEPTEEATPDWAKDVLAAATNSGLTEMETPKGFRKGIQLRPYQKQSLFWMTQREKGSGTQELLDLLHQLAARPAVTPTAAAAAAIHCDCGPVLVDTTVVSVPSVASGLIEKNEPLAEDSVNHPLWERRFLCNPDRTKALGFYVQPSFRNASAHPPEPPRPCKGGILADSMGLGKTVQLLALVQSDKDNGGDGNTNSTTASSSNNNNNNSTLVIAPLSLLHQWQQEIETKTTLSHRVHYNDGGKKAVCKKTNEVDVVLTTYGTLQADFRSRGSNNNNSALLSEQRWKRVILDECHTIKNHSTMVARACSSLVAERRWAVSGTIIQNSLEDVYSLLRFLKHEPFSEHTFWKATVTKASEFGIALNRVKTVLSPIMIRRTKESRDATGNLILTLPEIDSRLVAVDFSPEERLFYQALYSKSFAIFEGFVKTGKASSSWFKIFSLLHRLRQACSHVALTVRSHLEEEEWTSNLAQSTPQTMVKNEKQEESIDASFLEDLHQKFKSMQSDRIVPRSGGCRTSSSTDEYASSIANMLNEAFQSDASELNEECPICLENISVGTSAITPCFHIFCRVCLLDVLNDKRDSTAHGKCPVCSKEIDRQKILRMRRSSIGRKIETSFLYDEMEKDPDTQQDDGCARSTLKTAIQGTTSSKMEAIINELHLVWEKEPGSKVLIFSQFLGFLDIIEKRLTSNGIRHGRLDGKLSLKERMKVLKEFGSESQQTWPQENNSKKGSVLLISMKAGGVGLNLVAARSVFIVDPWWNGAVEDQCVDRIHRIGQSAKKIYVRKFHVRESIEERIIELQRRKRNIARAALCDKTDSESLDMSRPSLDDLKSLFRA